MLNSTFNRRKVTGVRKGPIDRMQFAGTGVELWPVQIGSMKNSHCSRVSEMGDLKKGGESEIS